MSGGGAQRSRSRKAATSRGSKTRRSDTRDPRRSRARALKLLYQADVRGEDPVALLERVVADPRAAALLDDLDPEEMAEIGSALPADHPDADPEHGRITAARARNVAPIDGFTRSLVTGVAERRDELDTLVQGFARRWAMSRMPAVDRNALRLGAYELQHESTSPAVVINEIVELAKGLSTDDSGRYVNGVLESIRKRLLADRQAGDDQARTDAALAADADVDGGDELDPPVPDPVALPDDVELVEVATPEGDPTDELTDPAPPAPPDAVAPADELADPEEPVAPDVDALDAPDAAPDDAQVDAPAEAADDGPEAQTVDELRHEHAHIHERGEQAAEDADAAQQQLF